MAENDPTLTFFGCVCTAKGEKALPPPLAIPARRLFGSGTATLFFHLTADGSDVPVGRFIDGVDPTQTAGLFWSSGALWRVPAREKADWDLTALLPDDVRRFTREKEEAAAAYRRQAGAFLKTAQQLEERTAALGHSLLKADVISRYAARLFYREKGPPGRGARPVFLSAVTADGPQTAYQTVCALCPRLYAIEDDSNTAGPLLMRQLARRIAGSGQTCYLGICPVSGRVEHLLLPDSGTAFLLSNRWHPVDFPVYHRIHYSRFCRFDPLQAARSAYRTYYRGTEALLGEAVRLLKEAADCQREAEQAAAAHLPLSYLKTHLGPAVFLP